MRFNSHAARLTCAIAVLLAVAGFAKAQEGAPAGSGKVWPGEQIFNATCAGCHNGGSPKAPPLYSLRSMSPPLSWQ